MTTIEVYKPLVQQSVNEGLIETYTFGTELTSYSHSVQSYPGFNTANFNLEVSHFQAAQWLDYGLARHLVVRSPQGGVIFEGFVNKITTTVNGFSRAFGPVLDLVNRARLQYSMLIDTGAGSIGVRLMSGEVNNTTSQYEYGIFEEVLSTGGVSADEVDALLNRYLAESVTPGHSETLTLGPASRAEAVVSIEAMGYGHLLSKYTYTSNDAGLQSITDKLQAIIAADPNGFLRAAIATNALQVPALETDYRTADNLVKGLLALGDAAYQTYTFMVLEGRVCVYEAVSDQYDYFALQNEDDPPQIYRYESGAPVHIASLFPGKRLFFADAFPSRSPGQDATRDPRAVLIDSITFRAPDTILINGMTASQLQRRLAQMGLSGIS